jgi:hypothetical protein
MQSVLCDSDSTVDPLHSISITIRTHAACEPETIALGMALFKREKLPTYESNERWAADDEAFRPCRQVVCRALLSK